jgi:hypothetical protein
MALIASLSDLSLPDMFHLLETGNKTGLLTLITKSVSTKKSLSVHYVWVDQGRLIAVANRLDGQGLVNLIHKHRYASPRVVTKLAQLCPQHKPLGLHLQEQSVLQNHQLKRLFFAQVVQPISTLLHCKKGRLKFEPNVSFSSREMTGLSIPTGLWQMLVPMNLSKIKASNLSTHKHNLALRAFPEGCFYSNQSKIQLAQRKFCTVK